MAPVRDGTKRRWVASAAAGAVMVGVALILFRPPPVPANRDLGSRRPVIALRPGGSDELAMRDLAPLFLPTRFNAAPDQPEEQKPGSTLLDIDASRLYFTELNPHLDIPAPLQAPATPVEALDDMPGPLTAGIGQTDVVIKPMAPHGAFVEIFAEASGQVVLNKVIAEDERPASAGVSDAAWRPLELMASVDASGLVAPLVLTSSSGVRAVDDYFRSYLAQRFHIGDRLTPGFYRIVVGP